MNQPSNDNHNMEDLMALPYEIETIGPPAFRNLQHSSAMWYQNVETKSYPHCINNCAYDIKGPHPSHPAKWHALVLNWKSVDPDAMEDEDKSCEAEGCVEGSSIRPIWGSREASIHGGSYASGCNCGYLIELLEQSCIGAVVQPLSNTHENPVKPSQMRVTDESIVDGWQTGCPHEENNA